MLSPEMLQMMLGETLTSAENQQAFVTAVSNWCNSHNVIGLQLEYTGDEGLGIWDIDSDEIGYAILAILNAELDLGLEISKPPYQA